MRSDSDNRIADRYWQDLRNWSDSDFDRPLSFLTNAFLVCSFLYYHLDISIISDVHYDRLAKTLLNRFDELQASNVWHRKLIDRDSLMAGTMFSLKAADYPDLIAEIAHELRRRLSPEDETVRRKKKAKAQTPAAPAIEEEEEAAPWEKEEAPWETAEPVEAPSLMDLLS